MMMMMMVMVGYSSDAAEETAGTGITLQLKYGIGVRLKLLSN